MQLTPEEIAQQQKMKKIQKRIIYAEILDIPFAYTTNGIGLDESEN